MPWIYEKPNEHVVFCFVFYININFHIIYYSGLVKVILKLFGSQTSICKSFFIMDPNLHINFLPNQRGKIKQTQK